MRSYVWVLVLFGVSCRMINLSAPPIGMHSWRQTDTAAIARNFYEHGYRFHLPQVDWGGSGPGYVESEFPIYTYSVALGPASPGAGCRPTGRAAVAKAGLT